MFNSGKRGSQKQGLAPGTLIHVGEKKVETAKISIFDYDETHLQEKEVKHVDECFPSKDTPTVTWINIDGLHEVGIIERIGAHFDVHPLVLEDILHTTQRPKVEDFGGYLYIVLRMLYYNSTQNKVESEQVSVILGVNFIISFQEREMDVFNPVRERLRNGKGRIRERGADYLAYALLDAIVDNYFIVLEKIGEDIEELEEELTDNPTSQTLRRLHNLKREMLYLRKSIWPLREVLSSMQRNESPIVNESTIVFLKDVYDHTIQVIDTIETLRDMLAGMLDLYLSSVSNRMNEVMKVLTIIATIFIPLTFIVGVYGMNFEYMPELNWRWGYPAVWSVMLALGLLMTLYFKKKRWL